MSKATTKKRTKFYTGVSLDRDVAEYLEALVEHTRWNRSLVLNAVVREHARMMKERTTDDQLHALNSEVIRL